MFSTLNLSKHAVLRMAQRNVSPGDLEYVLEYGERLNKTGLTVYILRKRDIPHNDRSRSEITWLERTVVLTGLTRDGKLEIITAYRNKNAPKAFRSKNKYDYIGMIVIGHEPGGSFRGRDNRIDLSGLYAISRQLVIQSQHSKGRQ